MAIVNDRSMMEDFVIPNYVEEVNEGHPRASFRAYLQWEILHLRLVGLPLSHRLTHKKRCAGVGLCIIRIHWEPPVFDLGNKDYVRTSVFFPRRNPHCNRVQVALPRPLVFRYPQFCGFCRWVVVGCHMMENHPISLKEAVEDGSRVFSSVCISTSSSN